MCRRACVGRLAGPASRGTGGFGTVSLGERKDMRVPELLVPASSLEVLRIAVVLGADAV